MPETRPRIIKSLCSSHGSENLKESNVLQPKEGHEVISDMT